METHSNYVIRGGIEGVKRMRLLAPLMATYTSALFDRIGLNNGLECLDIGCAGGDVSLELARRVGPDGHVTGGDIDEIALTMARTEAHLQGIDNVAFRLIDIREMNDTACYDVIYARFLLTHMRDPSQAIANLYQSLRPGGVILLEDIDFAGIFTYPDFPAIERFDSLFCRCIKRRGGDAFIGRKLPSLLKKSHFTNIRTSAAQPVGSERAIKIIFAVTLENITDSLLQDNLATASEIDETLLKLYAFADNPDFFAGIPRVIQAWGYRPAE